MNPDYLLLPFALLCLWTPAALVSSKGVREKLRQQVRRHEDGFISLTRNWVNWLDLVRSFAGAWMLQRVITTFSVGQDDLTTSIMCVQLAILAIGVLAQTVWYNQKLLVIGPTFFLVGLTFALCGPKAGAFGLALGFISALMLRRLSLSFFFVPGSLVVFAVLFHRFGLITVFNAVAFSLPTLLAFACGERIAYARRPASTRRIGYVYNGTYLGRRIVSLDDEDMIPEKEDVPSSDFRSLNVRTSNNANVQPNSATAVTHFPVKDRAYSAAKPTGTHNAAR